jgi:probable F420-dependent oxidoreductase
MRRFRFSFNVFGMTTRQAFVEECRQAEQYGYDEVFSADHVGMAAPFPTLIAAAQATERMRVGPLVLNVPFWNPVLLAREVATADILTDGRLDVGLGAGHMKWEFDAAGIAWAPFAARAAAMERAIGELQRYFTGQIGQPPSSWPLPRPVQRTGFGGSGPPLLIGGTGDSVLRIAAQHAQIVGIAGAYQVKGAPPGTFRLGTAQEADERARFARRCAGSRAGEIEWHLLTQAVIVTDDRRGAAEQLLLDDRRDAAEVAEGAGGLAKTAGALADRDVLTLDQALETPFLLIGTIDEIAAQLRRSRERWGFSFITVHEPYMPAFAPVIERLRGE